MSNLVFNDDLNEDTGSVCGTRIAQLCPVEMVFVVVGHEAFERDGCGGVPRF